MPDPNPAQDDRAARNSSSARSQTNGGDNDFWAGAEIISIYTRAQALEDGFLVNVSKLAAEAGFRAPVAVTAALWADVENIPEADRGIQDVTGRLWDVLFVGANAIRQQVARGGGDSDRVDYQFILTLPGDPPGEEVLYPAKILIGPGDDGSPVFTILKPNED